VCISQWCGCPHPHADRRDIPVNPFEFIGWNIISILGIFLIIILYLTSIINRRRKNKFLHEQSREEKDRPPEDADPM
jgi:hypothetical protein